MSEVDDLVKSCAIRNDLTKSDLEFMRERIKRERRSTVKVSQKGIPRHTYHRWYFLSEEVRPVHQGSMQKIFGHVVLTFRCIDCPSLKHETWSEHSLQRHLEKNLPLG